MNFARDAVAALFLVAVVAAGVVGAHGSPVSNAGQPLDHVPPVQGPKPAMLAGPKDTQLQQQSAANTAYYVRSAEGGTFRHRAGMIRRQIADTHPLSRPDWMLVWGARDNLTQTLEKDLPVPGARMRSAMRSTLGTPKGLVRTGHLTVIGPVALVADCNTAAVQKLDRVERSAAGSVGLSPYYIDPVTAGWAVTERATVTQPPVVLTATVQPTP